MVSKWNHPQLALFQFSEILVTSFTQMNHFKLWLTTGMPRIAQRAEVALFCFKHICGGLDLDQHPVKDSTGRMSQVLVKPLNIIFSSYYYTAPPSSNTKHPKWFFILGGEFNIGDPNIKFKTLIIKTILVYNICLIQFLFKTYSKIAKTVPWWGP